MLSEEGFPLTGQSHNRQRYVGHSHFWQRAAMVSRRQFVKTSAGAAGAVLASGLWMPTSVLAASDPMPRPIPGGVQPFGPGTEVFHVFLPGPGAEPSTITDFHGNVALANVDGTGTGTDTTTGNTTSLLFDVDMRFMQGTFIATDGNTHKGTFTFIWLDLYKEQVVPENQIHDFNPGIASNGVFWTVHVPNKRAKFDFDDATASLDVKNQDVEDYFNIVNALKDGNSIPATVSYHIHWSGVNKSYSVSDTTNQFQLQVIEDNATISWSASENGFTFVSDAADTSTTVFALIARERNGAFFPG